MVPPCLDLLKVGKRLYRKELQNVDKNNMYWETYDDQTSADFDYVGYMDLHGIEQMLPIEANLAAQIAEIRRSVGMNTEIRVYKNEPVMV